NAEVLLDTPGALWGLDSIDAARREYAPDLARVIVAIDPATTSSEGSDETGIIVAGKDNRGHAYADRSRSDGEISERGQFLQGLGDLSRITALTKREGARLSVETHDISSDRICDSTAMAGAAAPWPDAVLLHPGRGRQTLCADALAELRAHHGYDEGRLTGVIPV